MTLAPLVSVKERQDSGQQQPPDERFLAPTVFLTGAAVLTLEILGTRLLSPYFGSNLYVWSALISVTLIALALGYWGGGRLADAKGSPVLLDQVIAFSALWVAIIPDLVAVFTKVSVNMEYRIGILTTALVSFGPALLMLGVVAPLAVKLAVHKLDHVGRSSGTIYAWSTAGSIAGALAAGFLLFPVVSVRSACHITALVLIVLAAGRWIARRKSVWIASLPALFLLIGGVAAPSAFLPRTAWEDGEFRVVANYPSYYGTVRVLEYGGSRMLSIDGICHNAIDLSTGESIMPYIGFFEILPYLRPNASEALLLGMGGGDMVKSWQRFGIRTTAVEIDPVVARTAEEYFGLREVDLDVVLGDGRVYLGNTDKEFDFVIVDAFLGGSIPAHLFSRQAFQAAKQRMNPGGVLALNTVVIPDDVLIDDLTVTLEQVFAQVMVLTNRSVGASLDNAVFFASDEAIQMPLEWKPEPSVLLQQLLQSADSLVLEPKRERGTVITDQKNFVDVRSVKIDIALRLDSRRVLPASLFAP